MDRVQHEIYGKPSTPIIGDLASMRISLSNIFDARHIVVHELPNEKPYAATDIPVFLKAAENFIRATDSAINSKLYGKYPITQGDMNIEAKKRADQAEADLQGILARLDPSKKDRELWQTQAAWAKYRDLQAEHVSHINDPLPGSIAPCNYWSEVADITRSRVERLQSQLKMVELGFQ